MSPGAGLPSANGERVDDAVGPPASSRGWGSLFEGRGTKCSVLQFVG
jgi:hypothetical protein